jgi:hypothetical protein
MIEETLIKSLKIYGAECYRQELINALRKWEKKADITPKAVEGLLYSVKIEDCVS